jgi:hypothetical protein
MKKILFGLAAVFAVLAIAGCGGSSPASPTHVVAVYVDGLNHLDFRQTCSTIHAPVAFPTMSRCEGYFAFNTMMTGASVFRVVPHSAKVWEDTYRGRKVKLAVVKYANLTNPYVLTAHLRWIDGKWRIVGVSA